MNLIDDFLNYLSGNGTIAIIVLFSLSIYFIATLWIFLYRYFSLSSRLNKESDSLEILLNGDTLSPYSILKGCKSKIDIVSPELLNSCKNKSIRDATVGLTFLSIIATTSPFLGLFGTVIGILDSFAQLSNETQVSLNVLAPAISEALVATATGIFVAIPAYSFHLILKRKAYELSTVIQMQIDIILSRKV